MKVRALACLFIIAATGAAFGRSKPTPVQPPPPDPNACGPAIEAAQKKYQLPDKLLGTIAFVESAQPDPVTGRWAPWPWTIDAQGQGWFFPTKAEAVAAVAEFQAAGVQSIDVGCMQINLMFHPDAFASIDQAFDPAANAMYGARFLSALYRQVGSWPQAAAAYHSQTPELGQDYEGKVMALWPLAPQFPDLGLPLQAGSLAAGELAIKGLAAAAKRDNRVEDVYTPAFAARTRAIDAELDKLASSLGPVLSPGAKKALIVPASLRGPRYPRPDLLKRAGAGGRFTCAAPVPACGRGAG